MIIRIKNLRLRCIIGVQEWERTNKQDIILNIELELDEPKGSKTDNIADTVDYKSISKTIISEVENSQFYLLERLCDHILQLVMVNEKIKRSTVEIDKPQALRFSDSVSVTSTLTRS